MKNGTKYLGIWVGIFGIFGFSPNATPRPWLDRTRPGETQGSPKTLFSAKKPMFFNHFWQFRFIWGFTGGPSAKFYYLIKSPSIVISYVIQVLKRKAHTSAGHSPLGGWATIALISITSWFAITGSFSNDGILFDGPFAYLLPSFSDLATKFHKNAEILLIIILLTHLSAIAFYRFWVGHNLVPAMIHGSREETEGPGGKISFSHTILGLGLLSLCLLGAFLFIFL